MVSKFAIVLGFIVASHLGGFAAAQSIYSCVDSKGRKLTSDRPIAECSDRTQRELSSQGTTKRIIGPTLTAQERSAQEAKEKAALEERTAALEEKRRDRALLARYPNKAVHDKERALALERVNEVIKASAKRTQELAEQRGAITMELEFYKKDPSKAPAALKRRIDENDASVAVQRRFLTEQDLEKKRVNLRFDEELVKLKQLWAMAGAPVVAADDSPPAPAAPSGQKRASSAAVKY